MDSPDKRKDLDVSKPSPEKNLEWRDLPRVLREAKEILKELKCKASKLRPTPQKPGSRKFNKF